MRAYIVTGASSGLGLAFTRRLLAAQCRVAGIARHAPPGLDTETASGRFTFIQADLSRCDGLDDLIARALARLGPGPFESLCLINNAGVVTPMAQAGDYPADQVMAALRLNLTAPILLTNAFLAQARPLSIDLRIMNLSSGAAVNVYPGRGIYGASKAALDHFSRHAAQEQSGRAHPARIAAVYPGVVDTAMQAAIRASNSDDFPLRPRFDTLKRDGKLSDPDDAARRILNYLHSSEFGGEAVVDIRSLPDSCENQ